MQDGGNLASMTPENRAWIWKGILEGAYKVKVQTGARPVYPSQRTKTHGYKSVTQN